MTTDPFLIYDCEIVKCIPDRKRFNDPTYQYCKGWGDFEGMGISVIGFSHEDHTNYLIADPSIDGDFEMLQDFAALASHHIIVGFNSRNFDDRLLAANGVNVATDYDLLEEVRIAAGYSADYRSVPAGHSYSLDAISRANGAAKTGHGALAPQLWQDGKHKEVIDYCLNDVVLTLKILQMGLEGQLVDPNTGKKLTLRPVSKIDSQRS